jgi:hypothetical protein
MAKTAAKCIAEIKAAAREGLGRDLDDDEVAQIVEELERRRAEKNARAGAKSAAEATLEAAADMGRAAIEAARIAKRNRMLNLIAAIEIDRLAAFADREYGDPSLALRARVAGVNKPLPGGRLSADARRIAIQNGWLGGMIADLKDADLLARFNSGDHDRAVARELAELSKPDGRPGVSGDRDAQAIAKIVDVYRRAAIARENRAGAWIRPLPGYVVSQSHDPLKLHRAGYAAWRDAILPRLDADRTFAGADAEDFLKRTYAALVSGRHLKAEGEGDALGLAFKGPDNLAKRVSRHRVLHFKDADAWFDYNAEFGLKSLREAVVSDLERAARNTALMESFGTNPRAVFEAALDRLKDKHRVDRKKLARLNERSLSNQFAEAEGATRIAVDPTSASVTAIVIAVQSMAKLGAAALSSVSDLATKATVIMRATGDNILAAWGKSLSTLVEGLAPGDRARAADLIAVGLEGQVGDVAARFSADDTMPGAIARAQRLFFKLNLLGPWTDANKRGLGLMLARDLALKARNDWADLDALARRNLSLYGFDAERWNAIRGATRTEADGRDYLMPDAIGELPAIAFARLTGGPATERQLRGLKDELTTSLRAYYLDLADEAVPTPGARERAILLQGTQPGTPLGVAARFVAQFKAFPLTILTKNLGRLAEADTTAEFFKNLLGGKGDMVGLANLMVGTTVMGYLAMTAKDLVKGKTPRDPTDPKTFVAAMLQGGGLGIYGDFVFGEYNRFGRSLLDTLVGPTLGSVSDMAELWARFRSGEDTAAAAVRFIAANTPYANLFYTRAALDWLFLYQLQETLNPGFLRRMERRIERENKQTFILPPSQAIPHGGGTRIMEAVR